MLTRRHLLAVPLAAYAQPACPAAVGLITDAGAPHLRIYLEKLAALDAPVVGIADASKASFDQARKVFAGRECKLFETPAAMLSALHPSLTVVAMEAHHAPAAIRLALEHGSHVLAEKPACVRAADFEPLVDLASQKNRHLMLALVNRTHPAIRKARELLASGAIGKLFGVQALYIADQTRLTKPAYQASWFARADQAGGGHLAWLGIHYLDLIQFVTRRPILQVSALTANTGGQPLSIEDSTALSFQLEGGVLGTLLSAYYLEQGNQTGLHIWGSAGWLRVNPGDPAAPLEWSSAATGKHAEHFGQFDSYGVALRQAAQLGCPGAPPPMATAAECLHNLRVVFGAYDSASSGRRVALQSSARF